MRVPVVLLLCAAALAAPPDEGLAVHPSAEVTASLYGETGRIAVRLAFLADAAPPATWPVELVAMEAGTGRLLAVVSHAPPVPMEKWVPGEPVRWTEILVVPAGADGGRPEASILVAVRDPTLTNEYEGRFVLLGDAPFGDRRYLVGHVPAASGRASAADLRTAARERAQRGDSAAAFELLGEALRRSVDLAGKLAVAAELLALPPPAGAPVSGAEEIRIRALVSEEKLRWLRDRASELLKEKELKLALRVLEVVGGVVEEGRNQRVVGEPADSDRAQKDVVDLKQRLLRDMAEEDVAACRKLLDEAGEDAGKISAAAAREAKAGRLVRARKLWIEAKLCRTATGKEKAEAERQLAGIEQRLLYDLTPEQQARLAKETDHPSFHRLGTIPASRLVYLGPETLVRAIPRESTYRLDVAGLLLSDLFGRDPCPPGERVIVYYKETYSGPATGGGMLITVGDARPEQRDVRVDNGLYYHELTHCVDDTRPVHDYKRGLTEGLANLGAHFVEDMFAGEKGVFLARSERGRAALRRHHLDRENAYWLIPAYEPSEGLLEEILARHAPAPAGHADWPKLGQVFRLYRDSVSKSRLTHRLMAGFGWALAKAMGEEVWDTLAEMRFPVSRATGAEVEELETGRERWFVELARRGDAAGLAALARNSGDAFLAARARWAALAILDATRRGGSAEAAELRRQLGVVTKFRVVGPFYPSAGPGLCEVFPPEEEIDFLKEYASSGDTAKWRIADPEAEHSARLDGRGAVWFRYGYPEHAVTYALTHVTVPAATPALAWIGADDEVALWQNGVFVDRSQGDRPLVPDFERWPILLGAGRNRLLLKVANGWGATGLTLRLTDPSGRPIEGLVEDLDPPDPSPAPPKIKFEETFRDGFGRRSLGAGYEVAAGKFTLRNKLLRGEEDGRAPGWRPFSVRPGFPQDHPAALLWLPPEKRPPPSDFRLRVVLEGPVVPKMALTFDGEGDELTLSGWSLILVPDKDRFTARLERYDVLRAIRVLDAPAEWPDPPEILVTRIADKVSVVVGGVEVFRSLSAPPLAKRRFGLAVWGPEVGIAGLMIGHPNCESDSKARRSMRGQDRR
ncbi:MAG: hypothetical protein MUE73_13055 [Planctomycetes bacterium]|nr:hypothetical protein [Planctomycetota bacterium]